MFFKHSNARILLSEVKKNSVVDSLLKLIIAVNGAKEVKIFLDWVIGRKKKSLKLNANTDGIEYSNNRVLKVKVKQNLNLKLGSNSSLFIRHEIQ